MVTVSIPRQGAGLRKIALFAFAMAVIGLTFFLKTGTTLFAEHGIYRAIGWNYPQYYIDYFHYGFVKRGLIGTVLAPVPRVDRPVAVLALIMIVLMGLAAVAASVLAQADRRLETTQSRLLVAITVFSPLTFANLGFDFGRFDDVNLLILFASLWLLRRDRVFVVSLLTGAALLVHEAYLFYGVPLVLLYPWYRLRQGAGEQPDNAPSQTRRYLRKITPVVLIVGFCLTLLLAFGRYEPGLAKLRQATPGKPPNNGSLMVWTRPVPGNFRRVAEVWDHRDPVFQISVAQIAIYLLIVLAIVLVGVDAHRINGIGLDALALAPAGVLPLFSLGIDYARWLSLMWIVTLTVLVIKILEGELSRIAAGTARNTLCLLVLCAIPFGPVGIVNYFPLFRHFI